MSIPPLQKGALRRQVKAAMVDSAHGTAADLRAAVAHAEAEAARATANAQETCGAATARERAASQRASTLQCVLPLLLRRVSRALPVHQPCPPPPPPPLPSHTHKLLARTLKLAAIAYLVLYPVRSPQSLIHIKELMFQDGHLHKDPQIYLSRLETAVRSKQGAGDHYTTSGPGSTAEHGLKRSCLMRMQEGGEGGGGGGSGGGGGGAGCGTRRPLRRASGRCCTTGPTGIISFIFLCRFLIGKCVAWEIVLCACFCRQHEYCTLVPQSGAQLTNSNLVKR